MVFILKIESFVKKRKVKKIASPINLQCKDAEFLSTSAIWANHNIMHQSQYWCINSISQLSPGGKEDRLEKWMILNQKRKLKWFHHVVSKAARVYWNVAAMQPMTNLISCQTALEKVLGIFKCFFFKYILNFCVVLVVLISMVLLPASRFNYN